MANTVISNLPVFSDASGGVGQRNLIFAANQQRWWIFVISSKTATTVDAYVSSSADIASSTWSQASSTPAFPGGRAMSAQDQRGLGVLGVTNGSTDAVHLSVGIGLNASNGWTEHIRGTITGPTTVSWDAWGTEFASSGTSSTWSIPRGNCLAKDSSGFIHQGGVVLMTSQDPQIRISTNADTGSTWTNAWQAPTNIDSSVANRSLTYSFAQLAGTGMLVVYDDGGAADPNCTGLRYQVYTSGTAWPSAGSGNVGTDNGQQDKNDWCLVAVDATHIYAIRRASANSYAFRKFDGASWSTPVNGVLNQNHKAGSGMYACPDGSGGFWLFVLDSANGNPVMASHCFNANGATPQFGNWVTLEPAASPAVSRNYTAGAQAAGNGQIGVIYTSGNNANFDILANEQPATYLSEGPATLSGVAAAYWAINAFAAGFQSGAFQSDAFQMDAASSSSSYTYDGSGRFTLSGAVGTADSMAYAGSGGVTLTGPASVTDSMTWGASGGCSLAGTQSNYCTATPSVSGGCTLSGTAGLYVTYVYAAASGGCTASGTSSQQTSGSYASTGGQRLTGTADVTVTMTWAGSGSLTLTGTAGVTDSMSWASSGGPTLSGVADERTSGAYAASGSVTFSGVFTCLPGFGFNASGSCTLTGVHGLSGTVATAAAGGCTFGGTADERTNGAYAWAGSATLTGTAGLYATYVYAAASGGCSAAGQSTQQTSGVYAAAGSASLTGAAGVTVSMSWGGTGGCTLTGVHGLSGSVATSATGGCTLAGAATERASGVYDSSGGCTVSGLASAYQSQTAGGGCVLTGAADAQASTASNITGNGGFVLTGTPSLAASYVYRAGGSVSLGGDARPAATYSNQNAAGGGSLTGSAAVQAGGVFLPAGGVSVAGTPSLAANYKYLADGSSSLGGVSSQQDGGSYSATGSASLSGVATERAGGAYDSSGGCTLAGTSLLKATYVYAAGGSLSAGGSAAEQLSGSYAAAGGVALTGGHSFAISMAWAGTGGCTLAGTPLLKATYAAYQCSGAFVLGGDASVLGAGSFSHTMVGGHVLAGTPTLVAAYAYLAGGATSPGGSARTFLAASPDLAFGSVTLAGASGTAAGMAWASAASATLSGTASATASALAVALGGTSIRGGHLLSGTVETSAQGGGMISGTVGVKAAVLVAGQGGAVLDGGSTQRASGLYRAAGVQSVSGGSEAHLGLLYEAGGAVAASGRAGGPAVGYVPGVGGDLVISGATPPRWSQIAEGGLALSGTLFVALPNHSHEMSGGFRARNIGGASSTSVGTGRAIDLGTPNREAGAVFESGQDTASTTIVRVTLAEGGRRTVTTADGRTIDAESFRSAQGQRAWYGQRAAAARAAARYQRGVAAATPIKPYLGGAAVQAADSGGGAAPSKPKKPAALEGQDFGT